MKIKGNVIKGNFINIDTDNGKLHLILDLIERSDLKQVINEQFDKKAQRELFQFLKVILADEITFIMKLMEADRSR